jgi:Undecaprenyl-phosphate galactose phosphotransferase WbaP
MNKKEVVLVPYLHSISFANADIIDLSLGRMSLINIQNQLFKPRNLLLKKIAEIMLVIAMLPVMAVLFAVIAILIKLDSPGGILFRQERMGKDNKPFRCYKFRSMYENGEELLAEYLEVNPQEKAYYERFHKYHNDPRITQVGKIVRKLSLDELPQIINVLKGEMNLIGPRPYMPGEKEKMGSSTETILHVAPGLTGLWQVSGRNELDFKERVELDNWYIQNWSLWLDFIIFMKTFEVLFSRKGAK